MNPSAPNNTSNTLSLPPSGFNSPGSSVFDLPIHGNQEEHDSAPLRSRDASTPLHGLSAEPQGPGHHAKGGKLRANQSYLVISGGTGCNAICSAFGPDTCYVLPVSDDGGSSSEIIRVLGGPSIGDIRSRLIRLIPSGSLSSPQERIRNLLAYRLPPAATDAQARSEWRDIIEGRSHLWNDIPADRKEVIRGFLVCFESEVLKRAHKNFSFRNGSIGNYFLAAAQSFFRSLPSAIFLFSSITGSQANIVPVVVTNHTVTIAAETEDGRTIVGQCNISHPVRSAVDNDTTLDPTSPIDGLGQTMFHRSNVDFAKEDEEEMTEPLGSRITRLFYINAYGHEIQPAPNPDFLSNLSCRDVLVYSCGSLWTSLIPCLALRGVASAIARSRTLKVKILLLNTENDRETHGYTAVDYVQAIVRTLNAQGDSRRGVHSTFPISAYITHLVYLTGASVDIDVEELANMGIRCIRMDSTSKKRAGTGARDMPLFDATTVQEALFALQEEDVPDL